MRKQYITDATIMASLDKTLRSYKIIVKNTMGLFEILTLL